ncbi:polymorphic toxin-type HINT domain-containing protein [Streptomyces sp. 21So2-11]|uniref:polymorphic toxin-type HINT domain-containing protein n=1 Tax=Streptomyces sp. 21So2-11 TaxID=3144408 RepID=UPI003219C58C
MSMSAWFRSERPFQSRSTHRRVIFSVGIALTIGLLPQYAPTAEAQGLERPGLQDTGDPVRGKNATYKKHQSNPAEKARVRGPARVVWPTAGTDEIRIGTKATKVDGLPLRIGPAKKAAKASSTPDSVQVQVINRQKTKAADIDGVLLSVTRTDDQAQQGQAQLQLDYTGFADAYGGDYGSRLRFVQYPHCLLTTPEKKDCSTPRELRSENNVGAQRLTADIPLAASDGGVRTQLGQAKAGGAAAPTVIAAVAGTSGDQGTFGATPLSPSAEWSVSNSSGAFNWSYPLRTPPVPSGLVPALSFGYNSQSADGQTAATNNQGSWIGTGFGYEPGFIERRYKGCSDDGHADTNGDQCWAYDNATIQLAGGASGELIKDDDTGKWRISNDDNSKVEHLTGAANEDDNGEHWRITTADGTQYTFGLDRLPGWSTGKEETNSTWTVPVYGDDADEPCYNATLANAHCQQAWRWNLDYVKDSHGNVMSFAYGRESNYYTQGLKTTENGKAYTRGGYLRRIDYGQRDGKVYTEPAAGRVVFEVNERCIGATADCEPADLTDTTATRWPDVPWDRNCKVDTKCEGQNSPTFWTRKKLDKVTTQVRAGTGYSDVDSWKFTHLYTDNGDGSRSLWLNNIDHSGHVGGSTATMPSVELLGQQLPNRVDKPGDNIQAMNRFRLSAVDNDTGGQLDIIYADADCTATNLPAADSSTKRCYPVKWNPPGVEDPITDWFHKYVVDRVVQTDLTGGAPDMVNTYDYLGGAGWKTPKPDGISDPEYRTRSDWRGYGKVRVTNSDGTINASNTRSEHTFLRGLGGTVTDSEGASHSDSDEQSGFELETATYNGAYTADKVVTKSISTLWTHATATRVKSWGTSKAWYSRPATMSTYTALEGGGWQELASTTRYDSASGRVTEVDDYGKVGDGSDNQCTRTEYADSATAHILTAVARVEKVAVACADPVARKTQVLSDDRTFYDGMGLGEAPTKGDTTKVQKLTSHNGTTATYRTVTESAPADFDIYGRFTKVKDAAGNSTSVGYTETDGLTTQKTETNALNWISKTEYKTAWGQPSAKVDTNGKRTDIAYDALGRLTSVWMPDRPKNASFTPSIKYSYLVRKNAPVAVKTEKISNDGSYGTEYTLYDGLLRPRQEQTQGTGGGRMVADTFYDGLGRIAKTYTDYYTSGSASDQLFKAVNGDVDAQTRTEFDGAGRTTASIFQVAGEEKWRTSYAYGGDRVHVDPPAGQAPTTTVTDARGHTTDIRRYKGDKPLPTGTSADYEAMRYTYSPAGQLKTVKDAAANTWSYEYDQLGRKTDATDPDTGKSSYTYDVLDRAVSATDAKGKTSTKYDALGRTLSTWEGEPDTGTRLTLSTYDKLAKGEPHGTYRYAKGAVQSSTVVAELDDMYQPTKVNHTLAGTSAPELNGTYEYTTQYNRDGTVQSVGIPAAGGLPAETLSYVYDELQRPTQLKTSLGSTYVNAARYSPTSLLQQLELSTGGAADKKTWLTYEYERGSDRLTRSRVDRESAPAVTYDARYTYDATGNVTAVADAPTGGQADVQCFDHDWQQRLTDAWSTANASDGAVGSGATNAACASAPAASAIGGPAAYWHSFEYDASGNRKKQVIHGIAGAGDTTKTYAYGDQDQDGTAGESGDGGPHMLTKVVQDVPQSGQSPAVHSQDTFTYDGAGNTDKRILNGDTQTLDWNAEGKLTKSTQGTKESTFAYDAAGERVLRTEPDATTFYLPGMELRLDAATKATAGTRYYSMASETVALRTKDGVEFLASDPHGTAEIAVNAVTGQITRRRMDPFGSERGDNPTPWVDDKGFLGKSTDKSTGLTHIGAREYEPENGRFISADPIINVTNPQQINGYAYANNSPISNADPTGLCAEVGCPSIDRNGVNHTPLPRGSKQATPWPPPRPSVAHHQSYVTQAHRASDGSRQRAEAAKQRAIAAAKELVDIAMDELGITDALDCFTTGSLGACGATALNVATSFVGGLAGKLLTKYGAPWKWNKAADLVKSVWGLLKKTTNGFRSWYKNKKSADRLDSVAVGCISKNSFLPTTKVLMADGTAKEIKEIGIGEKVFATDLETGKTQTQTVTAEIKGKGVKLLVKVTIDIDGKKGDKTASVTATDGHPFWAPELDEWVKATDLAPGQWLYTSAGKRVQAISVDRFERQSKVYNLTVAELHTYYVLAGETPVLVHNATPGQKCDLTLGSGPNAREGVGLENGDIEAGGVRDLINESGNKHGCHTCDATTPGTKNGDWIPDHQPPSSLVAPGSPQTAYPHCLSCARRQGGVVSQLSQGKSKKEW